MKMIELTKEQFEEFASNNPYNNYCQTESYGKVMTSKGFNYNFIGYTNNSDEILAAGMFLTKKIGKRMEYAYCPKGFIIDYDDYELVKKFTNNLIKYYKRKNIIFLKINPEIHISTLEKSNDYQKTPTKHISLLDEMKKYGYKRRKEIEPLQLLQPKITAIIDLKTFDIHKLEKEIISNIKETEKKGIEYEFTDIKNIDLVCNLIKNTDEYNIDFYKKIVENYSDTNNLDILLLKINHEKYLINAKKRVEDEETRNDLLNERLQNDTSEKNLHEKMKSDEILENYKQDIINATKCLKNNKTSYVAAAIIIKHDNKINIIAEGFDKEYNNMNLNHYLYYRIIEMYKNDYEQLDLNAIADDFKENSKYAEFNKVKLEFNPIIKEYIGELDLVISNWKFKIAEKNNLLSQEFTKKKDTN